NGNNYSKEWETEAKNRGLLNLTDTVEALPYFISEKSINLFTSHKIYTEAEMRSRYEILLENYCKVINIEALTLVEMVKKDIIPAVSAFNKHLSETIIAKRTVSDKIDVSVEETLLVRLSELNAKAFDKVIALEKAANGVMDFKNITEASKYFRDIILQGMTELRNFIDEMEANTDSKFWPYPTYTELLFNI
ncbi:MAG: glutamine synthetase type III, partial [Clostridia bacterium]|nr:glutamine synthetase type III [Clostridia bacterium]